MADLISVIVSTYNRADALDAVLRSLSTQTDRNFEIVVADDGSRPDTGKVVARWRARAGVPVSHVWHDDQGFRLAEISNRAILASQGTYCIFLDGDCLARPGFIAAHRAVVQPGMVRHRQPLAALADVDRARSRGRTRAGAMGSWHPDRAAPARRHQPHRTVAAAVVGRVGEAQRAALARRARQQHGVLARRPRRGRWLRCGVRRLGPRRLRICLRA